MARNCFWYSAWVDAWILIFHIFLASFLSLLMICVSGNNKEEAIQSFEEASKVLLEWFTVNLMKSNVDKCHLFVNANDKVNI